MLLVSKITGASTKPWSEVAVQMVPFRWHKDVRKIMRKWAVEWSRPLSFPLQLDSENYHRYGIFLGPTPNLGMLDCHYSVLAEGQTPHPPHVHDEEEIIVPLVGEVDIIRAATAGWTESRDQRIGFGRLVYHPSRLPHTIRAVGPGPSGYLVLRWSAPAGERIPADAVSAASFDLSEALAKEPAETEGSSRTLIFEGPTRLLRRLHAHVSFARPGKGSQPHQDSHDVAVIVLKGAVETTSGRVEAPGIIFHPAGTTHFIRSVGEKPARYLAIEFLKRG
jgi:quercetin dioxygenase-like cupin family protein